MSLCPPFESYKSINTFISQPLHCYTEGKKTTFSPGDVVFDLECLLENIGDLSYDRQTGEG